jgi:hypothetical protein
VPSIIKKKEFCPAYMATNHKIGPKKERKEKKRKTPP